MTYKSEYRKKAFISLLIIFWSCLEKYCFCGRFSCQFEWWIGSKEMSVLIWYFCRIFFTFHSSLFVVFSEVFWLDWLKNLKKVSDLQELWKSSYDLVNLRRNTFSEAFQKAPIKDCQNVTFFIFCIALFRYCFDHSWVP